MGICDMWDMNGYDGNVMQCLSFRLSCNRCLHDDLYELIDSPNHAHHDHHHPDYSAVSFYPHCLGSLAGIIFMGCHEVIQLSHRHRHRD